VTPQARGEPSSVAMDAILAVWRESLASAWNRGNEVAHAHPEKLGTRASDLRISEQVYLPKFAAAVEAYAAFRDPLDGEALALRDLQAQLPWTIHYHHDFRASPVAHKDFQHALIHVFKAAGKLAAMVNDAEHAGFDWAQDKSPNPHIADLVICALRMANTIPGRKCDLQAVVEERIESKNGVTLARPAPRVDGGATRRV